MMWWVPTGTVDLQVYVSKRENVTRLGRREHGVGDRLGLIRQATERRRIDAAALRAKHRRGLSLSSRAARTAA